MNFELLKELTEQHQYDEIKIIGKDARSQGRQLHFIAMMRKGKETELWILADAEPGKEAIERPMQNAPTQKEEDTEVGQNPCGERTNRELMENYASLYGLAGICKLKIGDLTFKTRGGQIGCLNIHDYDSLLMLAKLADAGWQLPGDSPFLKADWKDSKIQMMRSKFTSPSETLPEWENAKIVVNWASELRRYLIERQVRLVLGDSQDWQADEGCVKQIAFTVPDGEGGMKDAICYINSVSRINPLEEEEKLFADPEYQRQLLEHMTPQELEDYRQQEHQTMEETCPRGMYFFVVEYECTLDLQLQFHTVEYLDSPPVMDEKTINLMWASNTKEKKGEHGILLQAEVIQSPMAADVKEMWAELFAAYETVPGLKEELKLR